MLIVQKFGGSSLADAARIKRAARRLIHTVEQGHQTVAVVSAQGDTTDHLLSAVAAIASDPSSRELDAYVSAGELLSAGLMAMAIEKLGKPAISLSGWQAYKATVLILEHRQQYSVSHFFNCYRMLFARINAGDYACIIDGT